MKYIITTLVVIGLFFSVNSVFALTKLSDKNITKIVNVLKSFEVPQYKIDRIITILKEEPPKPIKPTKQIKKENCSGFIRCPQA